MRPTVHLVKSLGIFLLIFYTFEGQSTPQQTQQPQPPLPRSMQPGAPPDSGSSLPPQFEKEMQRKANEQRQADLKRDTEKLLKLSTELKDYVDKTNANVLSMDVIKKAEEIEKLARSVKLKMRGGD
jgi:hypothetical protein